MLIPTKRGATMADLEAAPDNMLAELVHGDLYLQPKPRGTHQHAGGSLYSELRGPFNLGQGGPGGWVILPEVELHFPLDVVAPDVSGWRKERFTEPLASAHFEVVPDWVCEVLSPGTRTYDRTLKREIYRTAGVQYLWLVDTDDQLIEAYEAGALRWELVGAYGGDEPARIPPFQEIELPLARLWRL